jgi:HAD superfamily hydrolase (TIGR01493 family)
LESRLRVLPKHSVTIYLGNFCSQNGNEIMIKAVAFDAFGTLVEITDKRRPFARLAQSLQISSDRSPMTERMDLADMASLCGLSTQTDEWSALAADLKIELASTRPFPEAEEVLQKLRSHNFITAVASNLAKPYAAPIRAQLGHLLDSSCLSFEVGAVKPDPFFYASLCRTLDLQPSEILMVGDTWRCDYLGATAAGLHALHLDRRANAEISQQPVSIKDLRGVLKELQLLQ